MAQHPDTRLVKFIFPDGSYIESYSTYNKAEFFAEKSIAKHPAWNPDARIEASSADANIQEFNKKFGDLFS
ncbi:50S ribosomal protein L31 [Rickettsiales endosymbiont of Stachyamoeba lipophora]|uniref:50S ribosomal protein L31 n=1 Tax=Rickettsiales endosymbiont of Stachyamoeba lipophora TaxID=2486578 RepID=UPI000F64750B|nr:50S ribosomal protein L31 [Rickettsiales endosymbiont of Stachyamoeba lipophora]AZL16172.1 50S ribosomal protein L31 [Rickettsiales endosymbiont of Stachyamoeba lipophora]